MLVNEFCQPYSQAQKSGTGGHDESARPAFLYALFIEKQPAKKKDEDNGCPLQSANIRGESVKERRAVTTLNHGERNRTADETHEVRSSHLSPFIGNKCFYKTDYANEQEHNRVSKKY